MTTTETVAVPEGFTAWAGSEPTRATMFGKCPADAKGRHVSIYFRRGSICHDVMMADILNWTHSGSGDDIIAYRIESALASAEPVAWELTCHGTVQQIVRREDVAAERLAYWRTFDPDASCRELVYTHAQPAAKVEAPGYSLSDEQIATLLSEGLKPEEIGGTAEVQHARVGELVRWFARLATGSANPKWARPHAFELAYFVATNAGNRHIDINKVREAGFKEGAMVSPQDRGSLERIGFLQPMPAPTPASVPDGWAMVPRVATSAMISSGWESGKLVGDTRIIISVSGVWDAMISTAAAHNTPASDYALCCDTPAYCSSVRRCTATDAVLDGPQTITKKVCDGCPHLKTEWWKDYLENDETDSGTSATCTLAGKNISAYWSKESPPPVWCPIEVPPANQEGAAP